jgi:hypothetical protein
MHRDVTTRLAIDETYPDALPPENAAKLIENGAMVIVGSDDDAVATLVLLGADESTARRRVGSISPS